MMKLCSDEQEEDEGNVDLEDFKPKFSRSAAVSNVERSKQEAPVQSQ